MKIHPLALGVAAAAIWLLSPASSPAQVSTATVYATVTDPSGALIPGARVTLTNTATGVATERQSNAAGAAAFDFLRVGSYTIEITSDGFKAFEGQNIELSAGQTVRLSFPLEVGAVTETVIVQDIAPLVQTSASEQSQTFGEEKVSELPLSRRNFTGLLSINTGVTPVEGGSGSSVRMNGVGRNGAAFAVDGGEASANPEGRGASVYGAPNYIDLLSIEGIQEVQMVKGTVPAEYGNLVGGQIQIVTRSGTNEFHGSLFHGFRSEELFATDANDKARGIGKNPLTFNQFGGSIGGPVVKNRAFFFFDYEGYRERALSTASDDVPTAEHRQQIINAQPIFEQAFSFIPLPNQPVPEGSNTGLYFVARSAQRDDNHIDAKGDIRLGNASNLALTYSRGRPFQLQPRINPNGANDRTYQAFQERGAASYVVGGSSWTSESRFSFNLNDLDRFDAFFAQQYDNGRTEEQEFDNRIPRFNTDLGWGGLSAEQWLIEGYTWNLSEKFAKHVGNHSLKFGVSYQKQCCFRTNPENPNIRFQGLESLLTNRPTYLQPTYGSGRFTAKMYQWGAFAQDDFRVNDRLTLNLGVRWDYMSPMVARPEQGTTSAFYNADGLLDAAFNFGEFRDPEKPYNPDRFNFGPRVGLAYKVDDAGRTVVRAGFGLMHSAISAGTAWQSVGRLGVPFRVRFTADQAEQFGLRYGSTTGEMRMISANLSSSGDSRNVFSFFDPDLQTPYSMQWHAGVQQQIGRDMVFETSYNGTRGVQFPMHRPPNLPFRTGPNAGQRPNPNLNISWYVDSSQTTKYHSWQTSLKKRYSRNFTGSLHYTFAKATATDGGDIGAYYQGDNLGGIQDFFNLAAEWGPAAGDVRHYFAAEFLYDLPRLSGMNPVVRHVLGGWQLSSIITANSGQPINIGQGSAVPGRPDQVSDDFTFDDYNETGQYLNPAAFQLVPVDPVSGATTRPGTLSRNAVRGLGQYNVDFGLGKNFAITESVNFRIRADMFSAFNDQQLANLQTNIFNSQFGLFRGTTGARTMQINTRLTF